MTALPPSFAEAPAGYPNKNSNNRKTASLFPTPTVPARAFFFPPLVSLGGIHSNKIPAGPTGKSGPPQRVDPFFRNFSGWTEPIH